MDREIINSENGRSADWIEQIYLEHGKFIESVIRFSAKDSQECDDIYQEIFMSLLSMKNPQNVGDIRNYLYILTLNKVKEFRRKRVRSKQVLDGYTNYVSFLKDQQDENTAFIDMIADIPRHMLLVMQVFIVMTLIILAIHSLLLLYSSAF